MSEEVIEEKDKNIINETQRQSVEPQPLSKDTPVQEEIDISLKEKQKDEKTKVNARDNSYLKDIINAPKEQPDGGTSNHDEIKKRILSDSKPTISSLDSEYNEEDNDGIAELIVEILDWVLVEGLTWYSMSDSSKAYETDNQKKKILKKYLGKYLKKKQKKYPLEFFLIGAFLGIYLMAARKAHKDRKVNKPIKEEKERQQKQSGKSEKGSSRKRSVTKEIPLIHAEEVK